MAAAGDLLGTLSGTGLSVTNPSVASGSVAVGVGDLVIAVMAQQTALTVTAVTDNLGNTYTAQNAGTDAGTSTGRMFWSRVTVAGTLTTINFAATASANNYALAVAVYAGPFTSSPLDTNPANVADIATPYTGPATGTRAQIKEVIISWCTAANGVTNWTGSNVTKDIQVADSGTLVSALIAHTVPANTTTLAPAFTGTAPSTDDTLGTASFKIDPYPISATLGGSGSLRAGVRSGYQLYDDFSRYSNGTPMQGQAPLFGSTSWNTTGAQPPTITSGFLNSTGTGYVWAVPPTPWLPLTIGCTVAFSGADAAAQTMTVALSAINPMATTDLLQLNFGPTGFTVSTRQASGSVISILNGSWSSVLTLDGATLYDVLFTVNGDVVTVVGPAGNTFSVCDPNVHLLPGYTVFWEPNTSTNSALLRRAWTQALAEPPWPGTDTFNPNDKASTITLSNGNLTATAPSSISPIPQARGKAQRTRGKVHFEVTITAVSGADFNYAFGISSALQGLTDFLGGDFTSLGVYLGASSLVVYIGAVNRLFLSGAPIGATVGDTYAIEVDFDNFKIWLCNATKGSGWNNDILANQDPATNTGGLDWSPWLTGAPYAITVSLEIVGDSATINTGATAYAKTRSSGFVNWLPAIGETTKIAQPTGPTTGAATFVGAGSLSATARLNGRIAATFAGAGSLSATARLNGRVAATFQGVGSLSVSATVVTSATVHSGAATFAGAGSLSATARLTGQVAASFVGAGLFSANATKFKTAAATLTGAGSLSGNATVSTGPVVHSGAAIFAGSGAASFNLTKRHVAQAQLQGASTLLASAALRLRTSALLAGTGTVSASAVKVSAATVWQASATLTGRGLLSEITAFDPEAWWNFVSGAVDASGNAHDGTLHGTTLTTDPYGRPARVFNGTTDYIDGSTSPLDEMV